MVKKKPKVLGTTRDGVRILEPTGWPTNFTKLEIRKAVSERNTVEKLRDLLRRANHALCVTGRIERDSSLHKEIHLAIADSN